MLLDPRVGSLIGLLVEAGLAVGDNPIIVQDEDGADYKITDITHETGDVTIVLAAPDLAEGPSKKDLWAVIDEYADAKASKYYMDDQGIGRQVDTAQAHYDEARAAVLRVLGLREDT